MANIKTLCKNKVPKLVDEICSGAYSSIYKIKKKKWSQN